MKRTLDQSMKHEEEPMQLLVRMKSVITARGRCLNFKSATYKVKQKNKKQDKFPHAGGGAVRVLRYPVPQSLRHSGICDLQEGKVFNKNFFQIIHLHGLH